MARDDVKREKLSKKKENVTKRKVDFSLFAPEAKGVSLAGDFNQWDTQSLPMKKDHKGFWKLQAQLPLGHYEYKFYVDGNWFEGSTGMEQVSNPFGTYNFVLEIR
jgi:1,4-alpha-glucan branching enzyme